MNKGFIKLHRRFLEWRWFHDRNVTHLFLFLLLACNYKKKAFENLEIMPGQLVSSYGVLSGRTGLTIRQVRTSINKLKATGEVTSISTSKYTVFTVVNWENYQSSDTVNDTPNDKQMTSKRQTNDKPATSERQTNDKRMTTIKEGKNIIKKKTKAKKDFCGLIPSKLNCDDFKKVWMQWEESRRERKKTLTAKSASMQLTMLEQYPVDQAIEIIRQSIMNDWQGLFPPKNQPKQGGIKDYSGI